MPATLARTLEFDREREQWTAAAGLDANDALVRRRDASRARLVTRKRNGRAPEPLVAVEQRDVSAALGVRGERQGERPVLHLPAVREGDERRVDVGSPAVARDDRLRARP